MSVQLNRDAKWCRSSGGGFLGGSRDGNVEGGAGDVVVAPLDHQNVVAPLLQHVAHVVLQVAQVFDQNLLTGDLRTVDAHQEHVLTWGGGGDNSKLLFTVLKGTFLFHFHIIILPKAKTKCICSIE